MEEIKYKLKSGNAILVTEATERLVDLILEVSGKNIEVVDVSIPLSLLKEKCTSEDPLVSITASKGFLSLIARGGMDIPPAMTFAMSMLPSAKNYSAITSIVAGILALIAEQGSAPESGFSGRWSLVSPQHPLVTILQQLPSAAEGILAEVEATLQAVSPTHLHSNVSTESCQNIELMRPVFLWILCDPNEKQNPQIYNRAIHILLSLRDCTEQTSLILECLGWQQTSCWSERTYSYYKTVISWATKHGKDEFLFSAIVCLANHVVETITSGRDPRPCLIALRDMLDCPKAELSSEMVLAILSEALLVCPVTYLSQLLITCKHVLHYCKSSIAEYIFASAVLQWLYYPPSLAEDAISMAKGLLDSILNKAFDPSPNHLTPRLNCSPIFQFVKSTHSRIFIVTEMIINHEKLVSSKEIFDAWIKKLNQSSGGEIKSKVVFYLLALLSRARFSEDLTMDRLGVLRVLRDIIACKKEVACGVLPVLINSLRQSKKPEEIIQCLRKIIHLAVTKENVPIIISILETFHSDKDFPQAVLIDLYSQLVETQVRCYPYLLELLVENSPTTSRTEFQWEVLTAKAAAVKLICQERAANYGAEMVPVISGLLNRCTEDTAAPAYCLCLEGLRALWRARLVAPPSTWKALAPRVAKDKRPSVQISVCKLLSEVPLLQNDTPEYSELMSNVIVRLWSYSVDSHYPEVSIAAFRALASFKVEDMTLKQLPEIYRRGVQLPPSYCKTPSDAQRRPEDVLQYVPGECWANLFKYTNLLAMEGVADLCHALVERELAEYRSGVYSAERMEPLDIHYLPPQSAVRGLLNFLVKESVSPTYQCPPAAFAECASMLGRGGARPLPPLQWNFLMDLVGRSLALCRAALALAARQSVISGTALRFLQNYLSGLLVLKGKEDEISKVLELLPLLCKNVESDFIKEVLSKIVEYAFQLGDTGDDPTNPVDVKSALGAVRDALRSEQITEDNRNMLSNILEGYYGRLDCEHKYWPCIVEACAELSSEALERLTAPSSWWEVSGPVLRKACSMRVHLACTSLQECPIIWLNEIIDASFSMPSEHAFVLQHMYRALRTAKCEHSSTRDWLLQLMARTQVHMAEVTSTEVSVSFLCDMVVLSIITFAGYFVLTWREEEALATSRALRLSLFPHALAALFGESKLGCWADSHGQVLEWIHHSRCSKKLPRDYSEAFYMTLVASKSCHYFKKQNVWTKFLSVKPSISFT